MEYIYLKETESTNKYAKELAKKGADEFTVVIADRQINGYGRMGRSFYSPDTSGLYMSVILRPHFAPDKALYITTAAAVAAAEAIEQISGATAGIKWVNDIFINGKKISGILTESAISSNGMPEYAVLGIGVNIFTPAEGFPPELRDIAGSVFDRPVDCRDKLAEAILSSFKKYYTDLESKSFIDGYRNRCFMLGKEIKVINGNTGYKAKALSVDDEMRLIIEDEDKNITTLNSGEISVRM